MARARLGIRSDGALGWCVLCASTDDGCNYLVHLGVTMPDVVGVHGIGQQVLGRNQLLLSWRPALDDGVEQYIGRDPWRPHLDLAYYGHLFLKPGGQGLPVMGAGDDLGLDAAEVEFFAEIAAEPSIAEGISQAPPTMGAPKLPARLNRLGGWLAYRYGIAGPLLFFGDLRQVRRYQTDDAKGEQIRAIVADRLADGARVLIGHSLGSVVAYETLHLVRSLGGVEVLITLGSPLALRAVRDRLRGEARTATGLPPGVQRWINVRDPRDPVACAGERICQIWDGVEDVEVDNDKDSHAATAYLGKAVVGQAVVTAAGRVRNG